MVEQSISLYFCICKIKGGLDTFASEVQESINNSALPPSLKTLGLCFGNKLNSEILFLQRMAGNARQRKANYLAAWFVILTLLDSSRPWHAFICRDYQGAVNTHGNRILCGWSRGLTCCPTEPDAPERLAKSQHPPTHQQREEMGTNALARALYL